MVYTLRFFFPFQNAVCFIILTYFCYCIIHILYTGVLKLKKKKIRRQKVKIYIETAATCFGAATPSSGSALSVLAEATLVKKIANYCVSLCD